MRIWYNDFGNIYDVKMEIINISLVIFSLNALYEKNDN